MQEENKVKKSFFQNVKAELKKVIWPTGKQVVKNTFATIVFVLLITVILGVLNLAFNFLKGRWFNMLFPADSDNKGTTTIESGETLSGEEVESLGDENTDNPVEETTENMVDTEKVEESVVTE